MKPFYLSNNEYITNQNPSKPNQLETEKQIEQLKAA